MKEEEFKKLIKKDKFQVFLFSSPCSLPINLAVHTWFVASQKGSINRWEVLYKKNLCATSWDYLHLNRSKPAEGVEILIHQKKIKWPGKLIGSIEGSQGSIAERMVNFLNDDSTQYPFTNRYSFAGPNSNTFVQWVLDKFPEFKAKLPKNALGKNFNH